MTEKKEQQDELLERTIRCRSFGEEISVLSAILTLGPENKDRLRLIAQSRQAHGLYRRAALDALNMFSIQQQVDLKTVRSINWGLTDPNRETDSEMRSNAFCWLGHMAADGIVNEAALKRRWEQDPSPASSTLHWLGRLGR